jgi:ring-1,2-phenylacetyl-CoA epoxidase subunit PaaD
VVADPQPWRAEPASLQQIWALLEQVPDPEIPVVSIRELGILRDVRLNAANELEIVITPTYSGCPAMGQIADDVAIALKTAGLTGKLVTQLAPAWTTDWITSEAKDKLRAYGIAPPQHLVDEAKELGSEPNYLAANVVQFAPRKNTTQLIANNDNMTLTSASKTSNSSDSVPCPRCASLDTTETSHFASTACKALYKCLACWEPFDYFKPY